MVMHANEFETKEKQKLTEIKNKLQHRQHVLSVGFKMNHKCLLCRCEF